MLAVTNLVMVPKHFLRQDHRGKEAASPSRQMRWLGRLQGSATRKTAFQPNTLDRQRIIKPIADVLARWQQTPCLRKRRDLGEKLVAPPDAVH